MSNALAQRYRKVVTNLISQEQRLEHAKKVREILGTPAWDLVNGYLQSLEEAAIQKMLLLEEPTLPDLCEIRGSIRMLRKLRLDPLQTVEEMDPLHGEVQRLQREASAGKAKGLDRHLQQQEQP
jgi:hypothetical protein